jgi:DNA repair protein RadD
VIEPFASPPELFDYQRTLVQKVVGMLEGKEKRRAVLQLPTGAGKTRTAVEGVLQWRMSHSRSHRAPGLLWLAHTEELCDQAVESIRRIWASNGDSQLTIHRLWGRYTPAIKSIDGGAVVAGYQRLSSMFRRDPSAFRELSRVVDVVVLDEAHRALAPTIKEILDTWGNTGDMAILGLTATPGRGESDPMSSRKLAKLFLNRRLVAQELGDDPIATLQQRGILAHLQREAIEGADLDASGVGSGEDEQELDLPRALLHELARNEDRNERILERILEEASLRRPTIVFACSVDHARQLCTAVALKGVRAAAIDCNMRSDERRRIIQDFRSGAVRVVANYGVLSAGFDAPNTEVIVVARPTTSVVLYSQMIGRGLRGPKVGGTDECLIIDVVDNIRNFTGLEEVYSTFDKYW